MVILISHLIDKEIVVEECLVFLQVEELHDCKGQDVPTHYILLDSVDNRALVQEGFENGARLSNMSKLIKN